MNNEEKAIILTKTIRGGMRVTDEVKDRPAHAIRKICADYVSFSEIGAMSDPIILNYKYIWYHLVPEKVSICMMCHS